MTTPDIAAIAAGLTKAGRIILARMRPDIWHQAYYLRFAKGVWAPPPALNGLAARMLIEQIPGEPIVYRLTPLGLAVRDHLLRVECDHA